MVEDAQRQCFCADADTDVFTVAMMSMVSMSNEFCYTHLSGGRAETAGIAFTIHTRGAT
jgi:hypothetical protein